MKIYLIRHADAVKLGQQGIDKDFDRPLSKTGEQQSAQLARTLQHVGVRLDVLATSPLVRALGTAEGMLRTWQEPVPTLHILDALSPGETKPRKLARLLRKFKKENVAVVAHQPDLSQWAAALIGSKKAYIDFAKGGAACIGWDSDVKKGTGVLEWLITPTWYTSTPDSPDIKLGLG